MSIFIVKTIYDAGEFKTINAHFEGDCQSIFGVDGAEDITILSNGIAIISSDNRWATLAERPIQGHIYAYNLNDEKPTLINLTPNLNFDFHPHGISVFEAPHQIYVYAVNHKQDAHTIEMFTYSEDSLVHYKTISNEKLVSPNDLVAINENQFYVTNDHGSHSEFIKTVEDYLQLSSSNVLFYDGDNFTVVLDDVKYANGINISPSKEIVYVAESIGKRLSFYTRNSISNALTFSKSVNINTGVDNIELDENGNLWIGSHPQMLAFTRHAKSKNNLSPSQVLRVSIDSLLNHKVDEIYLDSGEILSGSSVSAVYNKHLLIGAVFADHFEHCILD
ncbi:MAG: hypothetical protein HOA66_04280 [Candidatus Marinimicrobia bacterium]|nr:hypothetical protein [Candidatus Neomarinimicrobiota bacterium]